MVSLRRFLSALRASGLFSNEYAHSAVVIVVMLVAGIYFACHDPLGTRRACAASVEHCLGVSIPSACVVLWILVPFTAAYTAMWILAIVAISACVLCVIFWLAIFDPLIYVANHIRYDLREAQRILREGDKVMKST
jgi:hypothetical protein